MRIGQLVQSITGGFAGVCFTGGDVDACAAGLEEAGGGVQTEAAGAACYLRGVVSGREGVWVCGCMGVVV